MANWSLPTLTDLYSNMLTYLKDRDLDVAKQFDGVTVTNPVTGMKRWNATNKYWEQYNGSTWVAMSTKYAIDVETVDSCSVDDAGTGTTSLWTASKIIAMLTGKANTAHTHLSADITDATNLNTGNMIVKRDVSGNFSAGTITAALSGNATTATTATTANTLTTARTINGESFNGSANIDIEDRVGTPIASATTTTIGTKGLGETIHITGSTTITSFGVSVTGTRRSLVFDGALTITYNATSLILVGASNITTIAGTTIEIVCENGALGYWRVLNVQHPDISYAEIGYLNGVTSNIQSQLDTKATTSSMRNNNLLINSNGLVNQRAYVSGTATTIANQYTVDRWRVVTLGQNLTLSTALGLTTFTAPAGGVEQVIEYLSILGGSYVLSFTGTAIALVSQSSDNVTYTTVTPSAGVYTITGGYYVRVRFSSGTFSNAKFELGTVATPYEFLPYVNELSMCQRYYEEGATYSKIYASATGAQQFQYCPYKVVKRITAATIVFLSPAYSNCSTASVGSSLNVKYGFTIQASVTATGVAAVATLFSADAEL